MKYLEIDFDIEPVDSLIDWIFREQFLMPVHIGSFRASMSLILYLSRRYF